MLLLPLAHAPAPNRVITSAAPSPMWVSTDPLVLGRPGLLFHGHTLPHCSWGLGASDPSHTLGISSPRDLQAATPPPRLGRHSTQTSPTPWPQHPTLPPPAVCPAHSHFLTPRDPRFLAPGGLASPWLKSPGSIAPLKLPPPPLASLPSTSSLGQVCSLRPAAPGRLPTAHSWVAGGGATFRPGESHLSSRPSASAASGGARPLTQHPHFLASLRHLVRPSAPQPQGTHVLLA